MMTQLCQYLKNWFDRDQRKLFGTFEISDGKIYKPNGSEVVFKEGQYFRIVGSMFNDGVWLNGAALTDETFKGAVWDMAVPPVVRQLAADIEEWQAKYGGVDSVAMSPFNSESFGGYSYSKSGGGASASGDGSSQPGTWQTAFESRLNLWRKV